RSRFRPWSRSSASRGLLPRRSLRQARCARARKVCESLSCESALRPLRALLSVCWLLGTLSLEAGVGLAPSVNILGSFFPAWLICIVAGVVLTIVARQVFAAAGWTRFLEPAGLVYPALACLLTFATWLIAFAS